MQLCARLRMLAPRFGESLSFNRKPFRLMIQLQNRGMLSNWAILGSELFACKTSLCLTIHFKD